MHLKNINRKQILVLNFNIRSAKKDFQSVKTFPSTKFLSQKYLLFKWPRKFSSLFQIPALKEEFSARRN